jgi:ParB-like nuclease domain
MTKKQFDNEIGGLPGQDISVDDAAKKIFNLRADEGYEGRVVALATPIDQIWADVKQPRRAIPPTVRLHWNGNPGDVTEMLNQWHIIAGKTATVDAYAILQGNGEGIEVENAPPIFTGYVELLRLAASIHKDGILHPITVIQQDGRYLIAAGERRWLAYHVLNNYMGQSEWAKIPARHVDGKNYVWQQAAENMLRSELNAIGKARQLALLIMETRQGHEGQTYNDFEELVVSGGCDRRFYAQIANGNIHRVPRGMGERIQSAMGLSMTQLSQYRNLLKLTDDEAVNDSLWVRADVEDWAEKWLREITSTLTPVKVREIVTREEWGLDDLRRAMEEAKLTPVQPSPPAPLPQGEGRNAAHISQMQPPTPPAAVTEIRVGDRVKTPVGHIGGVMRVSGRLVDVNTPNGIRTYDAEKLVVLGRKSEVETPPQSPAQSHLSPSAPQVNEAREASGTQEDRASIPLYQAVQIDHSGKVGRLVSIEYPDGGEPVFVVQVDGAREEYWLEALTDLGVTWVEWVEQNAATEITTDKADSVIPPNTHYHIIRHGSAEWQFLNALREVGKAISDDELERTMTEIIRMTTAGTRKIHNMKRLCGGYADYLGGVFEDWHGNTFFRILQQLETAANND